MKGDIDAKQAERQKFYYQNNKECHQRWYREYIEKNKFNLASAKAELEKQLTLIENNIRSVI